MNRGILIIIISILLLSSQTAISVIGVKVIDVKQINEENSKIIQLSEEQLQELRAQIDYILSQTEDENLKNEALVLINKVISSDGKIDLEELKNVVKEYYYESSSKTANYINTDRQDSLLSSLITSSNLRSTTFMPPYSSCTGTNSNEGSAESAYSCGEENGEIGVYGKAWAVWGEGKASASQRLDFKIGRQKTLHIDAELIIVHQSGAFGFAGAETKLFYKNTIGENIEINIGNQDIFSWIITTLITLISVILIPLNPPVAIPIVLAYLAILNYADFNEYMGNLAESEDAEIVHIEFDINNLPAGNHYVEIGAKACASSFMFPAESTAIVAGLVSNIKIDGIAKPDTPILTGKTNGNVNEEYDLHIEGTDSNNDPIKFIIDWGDGADEETSFSSDGHSTINLEHKYNTNGEHKITVFAQDCDGMNSDEATIKVNIEKKSKSVGLSSFGLLERFLNHPLLLWMLHFPVFR